MGAEKSSLKEKFQNEEQKSHQDLDKMMSKHLGNEREKIIKERKGDLQTNLTIRVYSEEKYPTKYINFLNSIKMDNWNVIYLDNGFSSEKTNEIIRIYQEKSKNKKDFDEVLIIIINSYESFENTLEDENKNFLSEFNTNLFSEEQPFFIFLNKNLRDFEYFESKNFTFYYSNYIDFEKECIDFISSKKDEYNVEIHYKLKYNDYSLIKSFLEKKKSNKDNFNVILENQEFIYSSQYYEEVSQSHIQSMLKSGSALIIKNLDYKIKLMDDFEYLNQINENGDVEFHFEYYKPKFNKLFEEYLSQYDLLDKRNFKVQYYYYSPYIILQKICGYYHEYGDLLIKDKFAKYPSRINIGVCGRAGAGKSTLLNAILGEKRCLEGQGQSVSSFITVYSHPKYPINFIDFPGFGDKNYAEDLIEHIRKKNSELMEIKEEIHVMIYCIKFHDRTFLDKEEDVIEELYKLNIKIIFIFTRGEREQSQQFKRFKNSFTKDVENILLKKNIKNKEIKLVSVYSMKEERNGHIIEPFGVDNLFKIIHESIKEKRISNDVLERIKKEEDEEKINKLIQSTKLLKICQTRKELIKTIREKVSIKISLFIGKFVLSIPKYYFMKMDDIILSLSSDINSLIYELSCVYCKNLDKDESLNLMNKVVQAVKECFNEGFKMTKDKEFQEALPWYLRIVGVILTPVVIIAGGAAATIFSNKIKTIIFNEFEKEGKIDLSTYLYLFAKGLNEGIDGIEKISEDFRNSYNS